MANSRVWHQPEAPLLSSNASEALLSDTSTTTALTNKLLEGKMLTDEEMELLRDKAEPEGDGDGVD